MQLDSNWVVFDAETTIFNKGHPFDTRNSMVSYAVLTAAGHHFGYYTDPDFLQRLQGVFDTCDLLIGFNIKFDMHWLQRLGIRFNDYMRVWDCQLGEFLFSGQELAYDSLNAALERYGLPTKLDEVKEYWERNISTEHIPVDVLREYNVWDVRTTKMLFDTQQTVFPDELIRLTYIEGEDLKALQAAEFAGIKVDVPAAYQKLADYRGKVNAITEKLVSFLPPETPAGLFNFDSGDHLSAFLYGATLSFDVGTPETRIYKSGPNKGQTYVRNSWKEVPVVFPGFFVPIKGTTVAKCQKPGYSGPMFYQTDKPTLSQLGARKISRQKTEILQLLSERADATKVAEMVESLLNKMQEKGWGEYLHGQFNQNVVVTGRLSSSQPNLQNTPPEVDELLVSRYD